MTGKEQKRGGEHTLAEVDVLRVCCAHGTLATFSTYTRLSQFFTSVCKLQNGEQR